MRGWWFFVLAIVLWVGAMIFAGRQILIVGPDRTGTSSDRILAIGTWTLTSLLTVVVLIGLGALFYKLGRHLTDRHVESLLEERRLRRSARR